MKTPDLTLRQVRCFLERVMGIEPTQPAWKAGILTIELHPHITLTILTKIYRSVNINRRKSV